MILSALVERLKRRSKDDFKGRHFEATLILQAVSWYLRDVGCPISGPTWDSCPAQKPRLLGIRRAPVTFLSTLARSNLRISPKRSARRALEFETLERVLLALAFPTLPLGAAIGLWRIRAARGLLGFCLGGTLLQRRLGFLARFDVIDRPSFLAVRTAAL